ncbi:hypothetical protein C8J57DRAFT_1127574 [Mycena rebaudengoi]|nr:hypothetical protein C8J57DRAFT_1127574 [Mycena rebaudengoi]
MAEGKRYTTLLSSKGHGHPVSLPNLSEDLPPSLRKSGLLPGDVCILHGDGSVEPLFNITCPEGDFTNRLGVPSNFEQLSLNLDDVRTQVLCHPPGTVISNVTVHKQDISVNANFECHSRCGVGVVFDVHKRSRRAAMLYLPDGASSWDIRPEKAFRSYALKHRKNWYKFVNDELQRTIGDQGLILLTGVTKATSWCIATVDDSSGTGKASVKLKAVQVAGVGASCAWEWENASSSKYSGPHRNPGEESWRDNQAVFLRGFQIMPSLVTAPKVLPIPRR